MEKTTAHVPAPDLVLRDGTPVSQAFNDVYFSRDGGMAETEHVFLDGNRLRQRLPGRNRFTVAELGFGTGLNFLVTLKVFRQHAVADATLQYMGFEQYPFAPETLRELLALQPALAREAAELLEVYPLRLPGVHRLHLKQAVLTLFIGEAGVLLPELTAPVDAWFLDGFAPAKNPAMWDEAVLSQIGKSSAPGATFATFTAAGSVKRGLQKAGFTVEKIAGYGHKRDMLRGVRDAPVPAVSVADGGVHPVFSLQRKESTWRSVAISGAGIAGATLANALARRGYRVTVLERAAVASGASGNAAGVLFPQVTKRWNPSAAWYFTAYGFMLRQLQQWRAEGLAFTAETPGMLRLPRHAEEEQYLRFLNATLGLDEAIVHWLERDAASDAAGVALPTGAAYFPQGTWIHAPSLCAALLQHEKITLRTQEGVERLARHDGGWQVTLRSGEQVTADLICVAAAHESVALLDGYGMRLQAVGGQLTELAAADTAHPLRRILCRKGYVIPQGDRYLIGATYHREDPEAVTPARHAENLAELNAMLPGWFEGLPIGGRSARRATTPDRMPYIGALDAGLYVSTGYGSRGLLSAPLAAEMIAAAIHGEQPPVSAALQAAVAPTRFMAAGTPALHRTLRAKK